MLRTLLTILMIATLAIVNAKDIKVIDSTDNSPLAGASVISSNGMIIGITDNEGKIKVENRDFPLTIRYMGYRSAQASAKDATISLQPGIYIINGVGKTIKAIVPYVHGRVTKGESFAVTFSKQHLTQSGSCFIGTALL